MHSAGLAAIVMFIIFGNMGTAAGCCARTGTLSPNALVMLVVPVLLIIMMFSGANLIVALMTSGFAGVVTHWSVSSSPSKTLWSSTSKRSGRRHHHSGFVNMIDIAVFAFLLMALIVFWTNRPAALGSLKSSARGQVPAHRGLWVAIINIILNILTVASTIVIVMEGPIAKKLLVGKYNITPSHSANMLDAVAAGAMGLISLRVCSAARRHVQRHDRCFRVPGLPQQLLRLYAARGYVHCHPHRLGTQVH
jgi:hypothetical protein